MSAPAPTQAAAGRKKAAKRAQPEEETDATDASSSAASAAAAPAASASAAKPAKKTTGVKFAPATKSDEAGDDLEFEDPYGDEMEEEAEVAAARAKKAAAKAARQAKAGKIAAARDTEGGDMAMESAQGADDAEEGSEEDDSEGEEEEILDEATAARLHAEELAAAEAGGDVAKRQTKYVWRPGSDALNDDEKLDYDSSAYNLLHRMRVDWPCLSFDVLPDQLGAFRTKYPATLYLAAGTQADAAHKNKVMLLKLSDLHKTKHDDKDEDDDDADSDDDDPDDLDDEPILEEKWFSHPGGVNRIRVCPQLPGLVATHADTGKVHVWNVAPYVAALDGPAAGAGAGKSAGGALPQKPQPLFTFHQGVGEGYSLAWSSLKAGRMVTGDGSKNIWSWEMKEGGSGFVVEAAPFKGHAGSVEDLVWSPSEEHVFASASSDKTIRIWDRRVKEKCQAWVAAHKSDVNVLDWNARVQNLLVSGADDGSVKVWDLRNFKSNAPAALFNWHRGAITSVEWHPSEESCLAVSSADDSLSVWDMALEHDELPGHGAALTEEVPPQLFFVHQGQKQIKELHWHKQIPNTIISTAEDGFNIFKPSNME